MRGRKRQKAEANQEADAQGHVLLIITEDVNLGLDLLNHVKVIVHVHQVVTGLGENRGQGRGIVNERDRDLNRDSDRARIPLGEDIHDHNREEEGDLVRIPEVEEEAPRI